MFYLLRGAILHMSLVSIVFIGVPQDLFLPRLYAKIGVDAKWDWTKSVPQQGYFVMIENLEV